MKKRIRTLGRWSWLCLLWLGVSAPARAEDSGEHVIIGVKGKVKVKRKEWANPRAYVPAVYGMTLAEGDLLSLSSADAQLTVVCNDGTLATKTGAGGIPCPSKATRPAGLVIDSSRGDPPPGPRIPRVLSPRATALLGKHPRLSWTSVAGASQYTVALWDMKQRATHWSTTTRETAIDYPQDAPELLPGRSYLLKVTAGEHSSNEEGPGERSFSVLEPGTAAPIEQKVKQLEALKLDDKTTHFLIASLYLRQRLVAEGIAKLEGRPELSQEAAAERLLALAYHQSGLDSVAEPHAKKALALSQASQDRLGEMEARELLGTLAGALGHTQEWEEWLKSALTQYREVKDTKKVEALRKQLDNR